MVITTMDLLRVSSEQMLGCYKYLITLRITPFDGVIQIKSICGIKVDNLVLEKPSHMCYSVYKPFMDLIS